MEELPTERTAIMITTLKMEGRPFMPAFVIAKTNGEAFASSEVEPSSRRGSVYGTRRPIMRSDRR
jgi:hypothetical protein